MLKKLRARAFRKGRTDGHKFNWARKMNPHVLIADFYDPPVLFTKYYDAGFDMGAKLEQD